MRLCTNTGAKLHLIEPLGFSLDDKSLKRANLDYQMISLIRRYASFQDFEQNAVTQTLYFCSTKATTLYTEVYYKPGDCLVFGPETRGLPQEILDRYPQSQKIRIPMQANARSLNLSNAVAIVSYEAWRQLGFEKRL